MTSGSRSKMYEENKINMPGKLLKFSIVLLIALAIGFTIWKIKFGFSPEEFIHKSGKHYQQYLEHKNTFHTEQDERMILMILFNKEGIFKQDFLKKASELAQHLENLTAITKVFSLTNTHLIHFENGTLEAHPLIRIDNQDGYFQDSLHIEESTDFREFLVSSSRRSLAIAAYYREDLTESEKLSLLDSLEVKIGHLQFDRSVLSGMTKIEKDFGKEIKSNFIRFSLISSLVSAFILWISLGSLLSTLLALGIIAVPVILILQLILISEHEINIIQTFSVPIIASLGLSHLIHLSASYRQKVGLNKQSSDAFKEALKDIFPAMFLTTLTTAIGYLGLASLDIAAVRNFGWITGLISILSLYLVIDIMRLFRSELAKDQRTESNSQRKLFRNLMTHILLNALRYRYAALTILVSLAIIMSISIRDISLEGSLIHELPKEHKLRKDYEFLEKEFCGTRDFEINLTARDSTMGFIQPKLLRILDQLEHYLRDSLGACMLISPVPMLKAANRAHQGGQPNQFFLPENQELLNQYTQSILQTQYADEWLSHCTNSGHKVRISGKLPDLTIRQFENLQRKMESYYKQEKMDQYFEYYHTGKAVILDEMAKYLGKNLFYSLGLTIILILLVLWWSWRSIWLAGVAMMVLSVSLIFMGGLMGLMGIPLKPDTALIFCLASGITVDGTIHLVNRWCAIRDESQGNNLWAIFRVYQNTGMTIFMHSLIMLSGFSCLLFSSLPGAFNTGLLVTASLLVALFSNITLLPMLLLLKKYSIFQYFIWLLGKYHYFR